MTTHAVVARRWRLRSALVLLLVASASCARAAPREVAPGDDILPPGQPSPSVVLSGDQDADRVRIDSLMSRARSLARAEGCSDASSCRAAALGWKACGGPKEYVVYCAASSDTAELARTVELVSRLDREYNERYGVVSDCMLLMEPGVGVEGGRCVGSAGRGSGAP